MSIYVSDHDGHVSLGGYGISWGNALVDLDLPGFFCINAGIFSLEFGDIDQGKPGIYLVSFKDDEIEECRALWQAK